MNRKPPLITIIFIVLTVLLGIASGSLVNAIELPPEIKLHALPLLLIVAFVLCIIAVYQYLRQDKIDHPVPALSSQNRQRFLAKVRAFWIKGVLEQSLHGAALIALGLREQPDVLANPWNLSLQQAGQPARILPEGTLITQVYDDAIGELLILGEPGSGKTTLLLELARDLLSRAEADESYPLPIVFNLSSWAVKRQPLADWLVEEMNTKYQVPLRLGQSWVDTYQVLPLLDGLDEVASAYRTVCVDAINTYRYEHSLAPMVVCSRISGYLELKKRLTLRSAVILQPLTMKQIDDYLSRAAEQLKTVRIALQDDPVLQELATTPLMLSVLTLTYQGIASDHLLAAGSLETRRRRLFEDYVHAMLKRRSTKTRYTLEQTMSWLTWLAKRLVQHNQTEFYIESMQPDWLPDRRVLRLYQRCIIVLIACLIGSQVAMVGDTTVYNFAGIRVFGILSQSNLILDSLLSLLAVGLFYGLSFGLVSLLLSRRVSKMIGVKETYIGLVENPARSQGSLRQRVATSLSFGLCFGLILVLINILWIPNPSPEPVLDRVEGLIYGLAGGLIGGLSVGLIGVEEMHISPVEALSWSWGSQERRVMAVLIGGLTGGLVGALIGLTFELYSLSLVISALTDVILSALAGGVVGAGVGLLLSGLSHEMIDKQNRIKPNQGIRYSAHNSLLTGLPIGLAIGGLSFGLSAWITITAFPSNSLNNTALSSAITSGLGWGIPLGLIAMSVIALRNGGYACMKHLVLRILLRHAKVIPRNYSQFLDYAAECILLRKVGGGYIFVHRLLLEYFASLYITPKF